MKKFLHFYSLLIGLAILASCGQDETKLPAPRASFFVQPSTIEVGKPVVFVNTSVNSSKYEWDFGDGNAVTQVSPVITFTNIGVATVTLKAISEDGQEDEISQSITVIEAQNTGSGPLPEPVVDFFAEPGVIEKGLPVRFINETVNAESYTWDFGDGTTSTDISPLKTFSVRGTYKVKLTAKTEDDQTIELEKDINVLDRVLTGFLINSFPTTNDGAPWDVAAEAVDEAPDLLIVFFPDDQNNQAFVQLGPASNVPSGPIGSGDLSGDNVVLTDDTWNFSIFDFDGEPDDEITQDNIQGVTGISFNPLTTEAIKFPAENGVVSGFIPVSGFSQDGALVIDVDIFFELK